MKKFLFVLLFFVFLFFAQYAFAKCNGVICSKEEKAAIRIEKKGEKQFEIFQEDVVGFSSYPVAYDFIKSGLFVTISNGIQEIIATPKKAIGVALTTGMMNEFDEENGYKKVNLTVKNDKIFFEVNGKKTGKIFGIWPVSYDVKATIDDQGKLASFEKPFILKFLKYVIK